MLSSAAYNQNARSFYDSKEFDRALFEVNLAISISPEDFDAYELKGDILGTIKSYDQAFEHYNKACSFKPSAFDFVRIKIKIATLYNSINKTEDAVLVLEEVRRDKKYANSAELNLLLIDYYWKQKEFEKAVECAEEYSNNNYLAQLRSPNIDPKYILATAYIKAKKYQEAIRILEQLCTLSLFREDYSNDLLFSLLKAGAIERAKVLVENVFERHRQQKTNAFLLNNIGHYYYLIGNYEQAIELTNDSIAINPKNPYAHKNLALILIKKGDILKAREELLLAQLLGYEQQYDEEVNELLQQF